MANTRQEKDSLGTMHVPSDALYGAQTARAIENFPISGWRMPREFLAAMGLIKFAAAAAHKAAGRLDARKADAICAAAGEAVDGKLDDAFVVDVFQTGSGTSTNMNVNEVLATRASQLLGGEKVHANDDVNRGQSSNDVIPAALHLSAAMSLRDELLPAVAALRDALAQKAKEFDAVVKIGRTHLMDAVPVRLGQEFSGYAAQMDRMLVAAGQAQTALCELALGGTAVGTGLNAPKNFAADVIRILAEKTRLPLYEAKNHFEAQACKDVAVMASGTLRALAISMGKIASDIRLMGSGPRCGLGELSLPATQPGSSIMPGKVNPVMCESVIQVACQVIGCDAAVAAGATGGVGSILELNVAMPIIANNLLTSVRLLANVARVFTEKCVHGLVANADRCEELIEHSLAMVTVLAPKVGYDAAAEIAKEAHKTGKTIRELCLEKRVLSEKELSALLDAKSQAGE
jgi:fumarate hydratase class II